ncbi:MAG: hypothetical protein ABMA25_00425 [Ilumatobacteraceae bacterium]
MTDELEQEFHRAMVNTYEVAKRDVHYNATRFIQMIAERGGLGAAHQLVHASAVSEGFTRLWEVDRLDLSVEALIHDNHRFAVLFSASERRIAERRLTEYGYLRPTAP